MAKRTAARQSKATTSKKKASPARKAAAPVAKKGQASKKKTARKAAPASSKASAKKAASKKAASKKAAPKKPVKAPGRKVAPKKVASKKAPATKAARKAAPKAAARRPVAAKKTAPSKKGARQAKGRASSIDARRRELEEMVPSPPSSLNMNRRGSAARTGRDEMAEHRADHATLTPSITGGDVDADVEDAYFTGDEAPGGDNPTPDQDIVDEIGKALGVEYQDNEELRGADKLEERDKHRWELDPASAEDYRDRDRE